MMARTPIRQWVKTQTADEQGITLTELLIAGAIGAVVISLVAGLWITTSVMQRNTNSISIQSQQITAFNSQFRTSAAHSVYAGRRDSVETTLIDGVSVPSVQGIATASSDDLSNLSTAPVSCTAWVWWAGTGKRDKDDNQPGIYVQTWRLRDANTVTFPAASSGPDSSWVRVASWAQPRTENAADGSAADGHVFGVGLWESSSHPTLARSITADFTAAQLTTRDFTTSGQDALRVSTSALLGTTYQDDLNQLLPEPDATGVRDQTLSCFPEGTY